MNIGRGRKGCCYCRRPLGRWYQVLFCVACRGCANRLSMGGSPLRPVEVNERIATPSEIELRDLSGTRDGRSMPGGLADPWRGDCYCGLHEYVHDWCSQSPECWTDDRR
jgi:hypothetical protein